MMLILMVMMMKVVRMMMILTKYFREEYRGHPNPGRSPMSMNAKLPHMLPQGGIDGDTEYDNK